MGDSTMRALITGAGRGLGLETARQLAALGHAVVLACRGGACVERAEALAARGVEASHVALDVTSPGSVATLARELERDGRRIDVLLNNAGVALDGFDLTVVHKTLLTNFHGVRRLTRALLERIPDGGRIVMVSSGLGELDGLPDHLRERFLSPTLDEAALVALVDSFERAVAEGSHLAEGWPSSAYRVSKLALNALTRVLARELEARSVRVVAVCPGWVRTDMGGAGAPRSVEEGARGIVWAATSADAATARFYRDGRRIPW